MAKIIREKYEGGVLVSREIERRGVGFLKIAKLLIQLVIAVGIAIIAVLSLTDSRNYDDVHGAAGMSSGACSRPGLTS
ncbi:MAG: hypothetical protein NT083_04500 [Rhodocyclales bacterium]|jgi:hypothetical protein|nr:hypothetical protein [Rhodocyclales bacterium]